MAHKPEIVEKKMLAGGRIAVRVRCCEDAESDSWHTFTVLSKHKDSDIAKWKAGVLSRQLEEHKVHVKAKRALDRL